jgi:hypothetical protein
VILSAFAVVSTPAGGAAGAAETCGLPIAIQDPDIRAAFARFEQNQSSAAAKACTYFRHDAMVTR